MLSGVAHVCGWCMQREHCLCVCHSVCNIVFVALSVVPIEQFLQGALTPCLSTAPEWTCLYCAVHIAPSVWCMPSTSLACVAPTSNMPCCVPSTALFQVLPHATLRAPVPRAARLRRPTPLQHYAYALGGSGMHMILDERGVFR